MFRRIFVRIKGFFVRPGMEWAAVFNEKLSVRELLLSYNMPLILLSAFAVFFGTLINYHSAGVEVAITHAVYTFITFLFSLLVSYFIVLKLLSVLKTGTEKEKIFKLVALPSLVIYLIHLIVTLMPEVFFLRLVNFYAAFLIWEGYNRILTEAKQKKVLLSLITSATVLLLPLGIFHLLYRLSGIY
ncbi:MAG: hypothetical protein GXO47_12240 [Chlorobi bacterium]|nr:hypothetical protein [Chlorobiota bacterium]